MLAFAKLTAYPGAEGAYHHLDVNQFVAAYSKL